MGHVRTPCQKSKIALSSAARALDTTIVLPDAGSRKPVVCSRCAEEHAVADCKSSQDKCVNCGLPHHATSKECQKWKQEVRVINYANTYSVDKRSARSAVRQLGSHQIKSTGGTLQNLQGPPSSTLLSKGIRIPADSHGVLPTSSTYAARTQQISTKPAQHLPAAARAKQINARPAVQTSKETHEPLSAPKDAHLHQATSTKVGATNTSSLLLHSSSPTVDARARGPSVAPLSAALCRDA